MSDYNKYQTRTSFVDANSIIQYTINTFIVSGVVACESDPNSPSVLAIPLKINGNWVGLLKDNVDPSLLVENTLTISNLKNPSVFNTYTVSLVVYTNLSTDAQEAFSTPITITSPAFALTTIAYSTWALDTSLVEFKFNAPIALSKGNRKLINYYDQFTKMKFSFKLKSTTTLNSYQYDLGYSSNTVTNKYIPCWAGGDLATYSGGLQCQLFFGKNSGTITITDLITVVVSNYKALAYKDIVSVSLMLLYSDSATASAKATASLINIVSNEEFIINELEVTLGTTYTTAPAAFGTLTVAATPLEVQAKMTATVTLSLPAGLASDNPAIMIKVPPLWVFSTSIFAPTTVFLNSVQLFTGKFYFNSANNILYVTPKDNFAAGTYTIQIVDLKGPEGASPTNNFVVTYMASANKVSQSTVNAGAITCFTIPTVTVSTDLPKYDARGATYFFRWTSSKDYQKPVITISMPTGVTQYLFTATQKCNLYIGGVLQREDVSPYMQVCLFSIGTNTFTMTLSANIPAGTDIMVALRYVDHPLTNPATAASLTVQTRLYNADTGATTSYNTECNSAIMITSANVFTSGVFTTGVISLDKIWFSSMHADQKNLLYFDFSVDSFLPKGTILEFELPLDFSRVAFKVAPYCFLRGVNKMVSLCAVSESITYKAIYLTLYVDFKPNVPMRLSFFGLSTFIKPTYDDITDNTITPFKIYAKYNSVTLAKTVAASNLRIYGTLSKPSFTIAASETLPTPSVIVDPINEAERALYNFTVNFIQLAQLFR